jgi:hypothetical protein
MWRYFIGIYINTWVYFAQKLGFFPEIKEKLRNSTNNKAVSPKVATQSL